MPADRAEADRAAYAIPGRGRLTRARDPGALWRIPPTRRSPQPARHTTPGVLTRAARPARPSAASGRPTRRLLGPTRLCDARDPPRAVPGRPATPVARQRLGSR